MDIISYLNQSFDETVESYIIKHKRLDSDLRCFGEIFLPLSPSSAHIQGSLETQDVEEVKRPARVALLVSIPTYNEANVLDRIVGLLLLSTEGDLPELMGWYWQTSIGKISVELFF